MSASLIEKRRRAAAALLAEIGGLAESGQSLLSVLIEKDLVEYRHFPQEDARGTGYRYFYHGHSDMPRSWGEHGHFHLFAEKHSGKLTHLVGLSVDSRGLPIRVFATNRWVTDEVWQPAEEVERLLSAFHIAADNVAPVVNRWIGYAVQLFEPEMRAVVRRRDERLESMARRGNRPNLLEDRRIHVISSLRVSLQSAVAAIEERVAA